MLAQALKPRVAPEQGLKKMSPIHNFGIRSERRVSCVDSERLGTRLLTRQLKTDSYGGNAIANCLQIGSVSLDQRMYRLFQ